MSAVLRTQGLGRRYGHLQALTDCTLSIPRGHVAGLVGPNGAGKTTLLNLAVGMLAPTSGTIEVMGAKPGNSPAQLAKVGYVAQHAPTYAQLSIADHLRLGAHLNPGWQAALARDRIRRLGLGPAQRAGKLSGGQRAQLALTLAMAKQPDLLILDEPIASLDPLARRQFLDNLAEYTAAHQVSVVMSSHLVGDLERVCDYLIVLVASRIQVAGLVSDLLASHRILAGAASDLASLPARWQVISASHPGGHSTLVARTGRPAHHLAWPGSPPGLEDLVLAYMSRATGSQAQR
jgi:ABC-2 type transport system ATP-binding protein